MTFEWKIAVRFLREGRGQSVFILLGISIGVAVMIFLNTLITGLQENLVNETVGSSAHIWIEGRSAFDRELEAMAGSNVVAGNSDIRPVQLSGWEDTLALLETRSDLSAISPLVDGSAFFIDGREASPVFIKGFLPERAEDIYRFTEKIQQGSALYEGANVLAGVDFMKEHDLAVGDAIQLSLASGASRDFIISGVFDLGNGQVNASWIVMDFYGAQRFLGFGSGISRIEMQIPDVFEAETIASAIRQDLPDVAVSQWIEENGSLLTALQSQGSSSIMIQAFVLLAITLGISSVLAVSVVQKSKQLGILKAMGTSDRQASAIFLLQGGLLGIFGALAGTAMGIGLIRMFLWGTSLSTGTPIFPLAVKWSSNGVIIAIAALSSTIAAFIPAKKSSRLDPVEVIRNG